MRHNLAVAVALLFLPTPAVPAPAAVEPWAIQFSGPVAETARLLVCMRTGAAMLECQDLIPFLMQHDADRQQTEAIEQRKQALLHSFTAVDL